ATRTAIAELARRTKLPPERLVLGGRSMGGRYCSLVAGDADDPVPCPGVVLTRRRGRRRSGPVPRPRAARLPAARGGQAGEGAPRPLPAADDAGAVRLRHARRAGGEARAHEAAPHGEGGEAIPLDRVRGPRLQAAEGERPHR